MKMPSTYLFFVMISLMTLSFSSCSKCAKKVGDVTEKNISLNQFHSIRVTGDFAIKLNQDSSFSLKLTGGEGILENVDYEIVSDTLRITNQNKCNFLSNYSKEITIEIGCGELTKIALTNPGSLENKSTFSSKDLLLEIRECGISIDLSGQFNRLRLLAYTGTPTINLKGSASEFIIEESSFGHIYAFDLNTKNTSISTSGTGLINVTATDSLKVQHNGSGIVRYRGSPIKVEANVADNSTAQILED